MQSRRAAVSVVGAGLAVAMLGGCAGSGTSASGGATTTPRTQPSSSAATLSPDTRACAGIQAVIGHIASDTARWSPTRHPFDPAVASRIGILARDLDKVGPQAQSPRILVASHSTAEAFAAVSAGMRSKKRARVTRAIAQSRVAYRALKSACSLD